jgi:hypothetical protein
MRLQLWVLAAIAVLVGTTLFLWTRAGSPGSRTDEEELAAEVAACKEAGIPTTPDELRVGAPKESDNAAPFYFRAMKAVPRRDLEAIGLKLRDAASGKATITATQLERYRSTLKPLYTRVRQAAKLPACDWHRKWEAGYATLFPEFADFKQIAKVLAYDAELYAQAGWVDQCVDLLRLSSRISRHVEANHLIGVLVRLAIEQVFLRGIEHSASHLASNKDALRKLLSLAETGAPTPDYLASLNGEVVIMRMTYQSIPSLDLLVQLTSGGSSPTPPPGGWPDLSKMRKKAEARGLRFWRTAIGEAKTEPGPAEAGKKMDEVAQRYANSSDALDRIATISLPIFEQAGQAVLHLDIKRKLVGLKIRLLQAKQDQGRWPTGIDGLQGNLSDPYSGRLIRYKSLPNGFKVYSIGPNRRDDGGKQGMPGNTPDDIVVGHPPLKSISAERARP